MPERNDVEPATTQVLHQLARFTSIAGILLAFGAALILIVELILWSFIQNNQRTVVLLQQKLDQLNVAFASTASEANVNGLIKQQAIMEAEIVALRDRQLGLSQQQAELSQQTTEMLKHGRELSRHVDILQEYAEAIALGNRAERRAKQAERPVLKGSIAK